MIRFLVATATAILYATPGVALFVLLFWLGVLQTRMPVVMYRGITLACVAAVSHALLLWLLLKNRKFVEHVVLSSVSLALAVNVIFLVVFPVTIDRSVTVYLLGQLERNPSGMTEGELSELLIRQYVGEYRGVNRRMREQILTGNVRLQGERYSLTSQGDVFMEFSRVVTTIFGVDPKYVKAPEGTER